MINLLGLLSPLWDFYERLDEGVLLLDHHAQPQYLNSTARRLLNMPDTSGDLLSRYLVTSPAIDSPEFLLQLKDGHKKINGTAYLHDGKVAKTATTFNCFCITDDVTNEHLGKLFFFQDPAKADNSMDIFHQKTDLLNALNGCSSEMVLVVDLHHQNNVFVNDCVHELLGWKADDFIEGGWAFGISLLHPDDVNTIRSTHAELLHVANRDTVNPHSSYGYSTRVRTKNGKYLNMQFKGSILERDAKGEAELLLYFGKPELDKRFHLTPREMEVARMLVQGHSSKIIAAKFNLSIHTVNDYRTQLMKKTNTTNTAALVNFLLEKKLI